LHNQFGVANDAVAIMVNDNSTMGMKEYDDWVSSGQPGLLFPDLAGKNENSYGHFVPFFQAVAALTTPVLAIVVSADPFFFRFRSRLMRAAQAKCPNIYFCFPFSEFQFDDSGNQLNAWTNRYITFHGATGVDLLPAYRELGVRALNTLNAIYPPTNIHTHGSKGWRTKS
jgi:hypothetical protein